MENAVRSSVYELKKLFSEKSEIYQEISLIARLLDLSEPIEGLFLDFSDRCNMEELRLFSEMLMITKRTGGQIDEVVDNTVNSIEERFRVEEEIETAISASKLEIRLMSVMPLFILLFLRMTSFELLLVMYEGALGRLVMTGALLLYILAVFLANRLIQVL